MATFATEIEQYWTTPQVAERLHVTDDCVRKWLSLGELERTKAGGKTLVAERHLQDFLKRSTEKIVRTSRTFAA